MTHPFEAREVPQIRKLAALARLDGLNGAIVAIEENTFAVLLVLQCQAAPILAQPRVSLNEINFAQPEKRRETSDLRFIQADLAGPSATRGAALTFIKNRHDSFWHVTRQNSVKSLYRRPSRRKQGGILVYFGVVYPLSGLIENGDAERSSACADPGSHAKEVGVKDPAEETFAARILHLHSTSRVHLQMGAPAVSLNHSPC
jgi:hypothetical protein